MVKATREEVGLAILRAQGVLRGTVGAPEPPGPEEVARIVEQVSGALGGVVGEPCEIRVIGFGPEGLRISVTGPEWRRMCQSPQRAGEPR